MRVAYYPGCTTKKYRQEMIDAAMRLFAAANIEVTNASDVVCCGYPLKEAGDEQEAKKITQNAVNALKNFDVIVTPCPTCTMMLREIVPEKVKHMSEYLVELLQKNLQVKPGDELRVNFHDPCHLGRGIGVFDEPREVLSSLPGVTLEEVPHNRENSRCCGGPALHLFPDMAESIADNVLSEMKAPVLITACPTCKSNLQRGNKQVRDIAEFVADWIE